jgi:hypothetical protein
MPGITITAAPQRYSPFTQMQVARFDGTGWMPEGPVISADSIRQQPELNKPLWRLRASLPDIYRRPSGEPRRRGLPSARAAAVVPSMRLCTRRPSTKTSTIRSTLFCQPGWSCM